MCATLKTGARADLNEATHSTEMASVTTKFHRQRKSATMEEDRRKKASSLGFRDELSAMVEVFREIGRVTNVYAPDRASDTQ